MFKHLNANTKIVAKNVLGAFTIKGISILVTFITTPLFIRYFNENTTILGLWYTLLSVLVWFLNFDLGVGNGIRNNLVKALTCNDMDRAKKIISSGMFAVGVITLILSLIGSAVILSVDLPSLFNTSSSVISSSALSISTVYVFIAVMLRFFLTTITSVFYALQMSAVNNLLALCVSVLQLIYVLVVKFDTPELALINVSFAYIFLSNVPVLIAGIIVFSTKLKQCRPSIRYIEKYYIKAVVSIGTLFFLCQVLYMIIANTNEFFVTNLYGSEYTSEYTFYYKLATLGTLVVSLALTPIWSVVTKAQKEGNYVWLKKLYRYIRLGGLGILIIQLLLVPFIPLLMRVWLGDGVMNVSHTTSIAFALFGAVFTYAGMLSTIANGLTMLKPQIVCYVVAVIFKFILLFTMSSSTSWTFVVWVNVAVLIPYIVVQQISLNNYFKKLIYT